MEQLNLFDFLGIEAPAEEPEMEETLEVSSGETEKPKKKAKASKAVTLPVTVYGPNFTHKVEEGAKNIDELMKQLFEAGFKEVVLETNYTYVDGAIYMVSPRGTAGDTQATLPMSVCDGMLQMDLGAENFPGMLPEEISLSLVREKWIEANPQYEGCELAYDPKYGVATPVWDTNISELSKGARVHYSGSEDVWEHELMETIPVSEYTETLYGTIKDVTVNVHEGEGTFFVSFSAKKSQMWTPSSVVKPIHEKASIKKAEEKISLPCELFFATIHQSIQLTPEMFEGEDRVTEEDILKLAEQNFRIIRSAKSDGRKVECVYSKEASIFSIAINSGKKGAAFAVPSLFKTTESMREIDAQDSGLWFFKSHTDNYYRVEKNQVATVFGLLDSEGMVQKIIWEQNIPKIPRHIFTSIFADFKANVEEERICRVYWDTMAGCHRLVFPKKSVASRFNILYHFPDVPRSWVLVLTIHSHGALDAKFSKTDDEDEQLTGLYGVLGGLKYGGIQWNFRYVMEGHKEYVPISDVFEQWM